jgi:hypothetical protein
MVAILAKYAAKRFLTSAGAAAAGYIVKRRAMKMTARRPNVKYSTSYGRVRRPMAITLRRPSTVAMAKRTVKNSKKSKKMTLRKNIMKMNGFRMFRGTIRGLVEPGIQIPTAYYGTGVQYCLTTEFRRFNNPNSVAWDFNLAIWPMTMDKMSTFTWCPYHPGGRQGWFDTFFQTNTSTVETYFSNYISMHAQTEQQSSPNYPNTVGPCNDNIRIHEGFTTPVGLDTSAYYYTILGYYNRINFVNAGDEACIVHVVQVKFKSKCLANDSLDITSQFQDNTWLYDTLVVSDTAPRTTNLKETASQELSRGKLPTKLFKTISHQSFILGPRENNPQNLRTANPPRKQITIKGKCNIRRKRTCASSSSRNDTFNAKEQLDEAYQRDTYYVMFVTPFDKTGGTDSSGDALDKINVQFHIDKTVLYNIPSAEYN